MKLRFSVVSTMLAAAFLAPVSMWAEGGSESQKVTFTEKVKIPGASLKPGDYTFSVEDRLQDRAIVRITSQNQDKHYLVLSVPSAKLTQASGDGLIRFTTPGGKDQVLRGWACPGCTPGLEFVYPKAEAAKLTDETTEPVLAVDPTYDKLPANLSPDDMKVVTLWLLSPEQITASNKGKGVKAEKYVGPTQTAAVAAPAASTSEVAQTPAPAEVAQSPTAAAETPAPVAQVTRPAAEPAQNTASSTTELAQVPTPAPTAAAPTASPAPSAPSVEASQPVQMAQANGRLPKTASNDYLFVFGGLLLLIAGAGVRLSRRVAFVRTGNGAA